MKLYLDLLKTVLNCIKQNKNKKESIGYLVLLLNNIRNNKPLFFTKKKGAKIIKKFFSNKDEYYLGKNLYGYLFCKSDNLNDVIDLLDVYYGFKEYYNELETWDYIFKGDKFWH